MSKRASVIATIGAAAVVAAVLVLTPARSAMQRWIRGAAPDAAHSGTAVPAPAVMPDATASQARGKMALDTRRQQLIGVRTVIVARGPIAQEIRVVGMVRYDETRQAEINTRVDGWIRELYADSTGKPVQQGDALFTLYSPVLVTTQNEYLLALRGRTDAAGAEVSQVREFADRLVQAARDRLARWDMSEADIQELERRGKATDTITVRSPVSGVVVEKLAVQGMRVMEGQPLFRVADLSMVWVEANVHEQDVASLRVGQLATMTLDAYPGETFSGRATYVHSAMDEATRTLSVRFQFANRRGRLRPGMYANLEIRGQGTNGLTVPSDAVLDSGSQQVVFVAERDGYFVPRPVRVGRRLAASVEITDGLREGEQVATGATFFLDSESQLRAGLQNYESSAPWAPGSSAGSAAFDITFRAQPDPPRAGENQFEVLVKEPSGQAVTDAEVTVQLFMPAMPTMNMPEMRNEATLSHVGGGVYRGRGQVIMAGRWDVTVLVGKGGQRSGRKQFAIVAR